MRKTLLILSLVWALLPCRAALLVNNHGATNITSTSAYIGVTVVSTGAANPNAWVFWGQTNNSTNVSGWQYTNDFGVCTQRSYSVLATNLTAETLYYFRAYATNTSETNWANISALFRTVASPTTAPPASVEDVTVDTNDVLKHPTNFFGANSNLIISAISGYGYLTNEPGFTNWLVTNTYVQSNSGNWAGTWKGLDTNALVVTNDPAYLAALTNGTLTKSTSNAFWTDGRMFGIAVRTNYEAVGAAAIVGTNLAAVSNAYPIIEGSTNVHVTLTPTGQVVVVDAGVVDFGTTDTTAYRGDWGAAVSGALDVAEGDITTNATDIAVNTGDIGTNATDIAINTGNITTNANNITTVSNAFVSADSNQVPQPTNTWTAEYVLSSSDGGTTTYAVAAGVGDFLADGTVPMTGDINAGGNSATNLNDISGLSLTISAGASVAGNYRAAIGEGSIASDLSSTLALGYYARAEIKGAVAIGTQARATGEYSTVIAADYGVARFSQGDRTLTLSGENGIHIMNNVTMHGKSLTNANNLIASNNVSTKTLTITGGNADLGGGAVTNADYFQMTNAAAAGAILVSDANGNMSWEQKVYVKATFALQFLTNTTIICANYTEVKDTTASFNHTTGIFTAPRACNLLVGVGIGFYVEKLDEQTYLMDNGAIAYEYKPGAIRGHNWTVGIVVTNGEQLSIGGQSALGGRIYTDGSGRYSTLTIFEP